jgi:hypothetical protein
MTNKPDGIFENGDLWYGERCEEDDSYFIAYDADNNPYETREIPERFVLFAMTVFPDGTPESFATEYMLAKKIGDARFGSMCRHERAKRGYCPDCLRKVI